MNLIDIGANLAHDSFDDDRDAVLQRARHAGLQAIIVTGSDVESAGKALQLAKEHPGFLYATAGLHPHHASSLDDAVLAALREVARAPQTVATGEMGLDFFRDFSPRPDQERAFQRQLKLAADIGKPVFLHQRDAHARFLPILREQLDQLPAAVVHCFTGSREELREYIDVGLYIGITGWICDERRGRQLLDYVGDIPADRLMLETDSPYLLPRNLRPKPASRRNEPMHLPAVLARVAEALGQDQGALAAATTANARRFFRLPGTPD